MNRLHPLEKRRRWSEKISQFNLLSYSLKEKHLYCHKMLGFLGIDDEVEKRFYNQSVDMRVEMKEHALYYLRNIPPTYVDLKSFLDQKFENDPQRQKQMESLKWASELDFVMCILVWHMATEICMRGKEDGPEGDDGRDERVCSVLSRYMLYLLVMYPSSLPAGIGRIKFHDMYAAVTTFLEEHQSTGNGMHADPEKNPKQKCFLKKPRLSKPDACDLLISQVNTRINLTVSSGDKSKFVLFGGCKLASQLNQLDQPDQPSRVVKWLFIKEIWVAMLILAALKCKASFHLQQLKRGGELLSHVWLLLVHYGYTDHFQIPQVTEIAELNVR